jgi:hypothetical protein
VRESSFEIADVLRPSTAAGSTDFPTAPDIEIEVPADLDLDFEQNSENPEMECAL